MSGGTPGVDIRPAGRQDAPGLARVLASALTDPDPALGAPGAHAALIARHLESILGQAGHHMLVADDGRGGLAGYVLWHLNHCLYLVQPEAFVSDLFVARDWQGAGWVAGCWPGPPPTPGPGGAGA